ncbi:LysR family transcriptional regulator [Acerihabitans sp. KWT182]|uniref:LysR family transcriptional regulator n=1 Tax=Acerihabitans sp. KWT182 TaxID=3157919 RepID=A0AAU7Q734_9GAMM
MDTQLLRAFVLLAETRNYREASQRLFITQPALTKKIKLLESELGLTLFVRGRHGAQLTHAGGLLLEKARALVEQAEVLRHYALDMAKGVKGNLAIGFGISGIKIAPAWVARFRRAYPDVIVSLEDISSTRQTAQLLSGQLQLAFMRMPVAPPLTGLKVVEESLVLAVKKKTVTLTEPELLLYPLLASQPFIQLLPEKGTGAASAN